MYSPLSVMVNKYCPFHRITESQNSRGWKVPSNPYYSVILLVKAVNAFQDSFNNDPNYLTVTFSDDPNLIVMC